MLMLTLYSRVVQPSFSEGHIQIYVIDGWPLISGVASVASLRVDKWVWSGEKGIDPGGQLWS